MNIGTIVRLLAIALGITSMSLLVAQSAFAAGSGTCGSCFVSEIKLEKTYNYLSDTNIFIAISVAALGAIALLIFRHRLPSASKIAAYVFTGSFTLISFVGGAIQIGIWLGLLPDHIQ